MPEQIDIGRQISRVSNKIRQRFDGAFADSGITGTQASILHFLARVSPRKDVYQRDIEAEFSIRRSSVTSVLNGLEQGGYIRRESVSEDARLKRIVLTEKALDMAAQVTSLTQEINGLLIKNMLPDELLYLDELLKKIGANLP